MPCLLVMDAQDGRIVTSHARRDVEDAYDDEIRGGGKGYLGLFLGENGETCRHRIGRHNLRLALCFRK